NGLFQETQGEGPGEGPGAQDNTRPGTRTGTGRARKRSRSRERTRGSERESKAGKTSERSAGQPKIKKEKTDDGAEEVPGPKSASGDASLSIEETNKLRARLGLKPLELNEAKKAPVKPERLLNQKLGKVKTLAEDDPWLDDTAAWVERSRKMAKEKELADKRAKMLEEMDVEFGISSLVDEEFGKGRKENYSSKDLKGLTVQHKIDSFQEGQTVILTLQDKGESTEEAAGRSARLPSVCLSVSLSTSKPYAEEEDFLISSPLAFQLKHKSVLSKYDEEIDGEKKRSFRLEAGGQADGSWERELQQIRDTLQSQAQSLDGPGLRLASEYYTPDEMVTFKKTKRCVKKIRKKEKPLKVEELLPLVAEAQSEDFGSRSRGRGRRRGSDADDRVEERKASAPSQLSDDTRVEKMEISDEDDFEAPEGVAIEEDEAELELQAQLEKQRKLRQKQLLKDSGEKVVRIVETQGGSRDDDEEDPDKKNNIVFNATSEFCRTLGDIPTYGLSGNREDQEDILDFGKAEEKSQGTGSDSDFDENVGWSMVNLDEEQKQPDFSTASTTILDEEPIVNSGLVAALMLCKNKGLLAVSPQVQKVARVRAPKAALPNDLYCIEDKMTIDDKYSRREEYRGFTQDFKDKDSYKPDVKIEYVDETGRKLTPKEAFRQLSHRFHGKGSGKIKTERRMKKLEEEALLKKMSSSDTPLGTVALLQEKQKSQKTPYIVLSGGGKSMNANTITK
ncbi:LOW QUALITY PROTEIN: U4/U6.U5 tri-snRNP-associated protein 1, partial [Polyodon spathula]|uniref:LOW QUALITY PROTEIN: U4/U6.U5 tri-snRNP-associated protein 1 n=1 Tax=Polyodon spathula TaxID=7913 RepID=UPI001B7E7B59